MREQIRRGLVENRSVSTFASRARRLSGWRSGEDFGAGRNNWTRMRPKRLPWSVIGTGFCLADLSTSLLIGELSFNALPGTAADAATFGHISAMASVFTVFIFRESGLYGRWMLSRPGAGLRQVTSGWFHAFGLALLVAVAWSAVMGREDQAGADDVFAGFDGPWLFVFLAAGLCGFITTRLLWSAVYKRLIGRVLVHGRAVVVGTGPEAERVIRRLRDDPASGLDVVGILYDGARRVSASLCGVAVLGGSRDMAAAVRRNDVDTVIVALPWTAGESIEASLAEARRLPVEVRLVPDATAQTYLRYPVSLVSGQVLVEVGGPPISNAGAVLKRAEDVLLASLGLLLLSPLMLAIAAAIKLDSSGPVCFKQPRHGFNKRVFDLYKFRSMHAHAADEACVRQTSRGDSRLTRVGAFLRRHSLDELPQLFNVLRGEMSIVGPRPHALATRTEGLLLEDVLASYAARFRVKPGITGWAQVNGWRGQLDTREKLERRVEFDLDYIERWSLALDLRILWLTLRCVIRDGHAY